MQVTTDLDICEVTFSEHYYTVHVYLRRKIEYTQLDDQYSDFFANMRQHELCTTYTLLRETSFGSLYNLLSLIWNNLEALPMAHATYII